MQSWVQGQPRVDEVGGTWVLSYPIVALRTLSSSLLLVIARDSTLKWVFLVFSLISFLFLSWVPFSFFTVCRFSLICEMVGWLAPGIVYKSVHLKKGFLVCLELVTASPIPTHINPTRQLKKLNARVCLEITGKKKR